MTARTLRNDKREARYQSMSDSTLGPPGEGGAGPDGRIAYSGSGKDKSSFAPKDAIKFSTPGFIGNALSSMPSVSYYTRLSIVHPSIVHNLSLQNKKKIIIAETATTAIFTITDLEITHNTAWDKNTRSAQGIGANITIVETHGAALLDYINKACRDLGIKSPKEATYQLEIMFNNSNAENVEPGQSRYYFVYPLRFTHMSIGITEKGGQYRITATEPGIDGYASQTGPTLKNVSTIAASSLGEWTKGFQTFLQECANDEVRNESHSIADKYYIDIDSEWKKYKFSNTKSKENDQTTRHHIDNSKLLIQIAKGSRVPDILNSVLGATEEFQKIKTASGGFVRQMGVGSAATDATNIPLIYRLVCAMRFGEFDVKRQKYSRKYYYSFKSYKDASVTTPDLIHQFNNNDVMKNRVTKLLEAQLLTKRYDYNFTGINTEVLNFDMNFDLTYFRSIPIRAGHQAQREGVQGSKTFPQKPPMTANGDEAKKSRKKNDLPPSLRKWFGKTYGPLNDQGLVYGAIPQEADELEKAQAAFASETGTNVRKGGGLYVESYTLPSTQENVSFLTLSSDTVDSGDALQQNITPDRSTGRIQLGTMYMELTGGSELGLIDLEIKGDPFWMGQSNLSKQFRGVDTSITGFAIYEQGAPMFWLNVNSPVEPDPDTGKMEFVNNVTVSGIFKVTSVYSRFVNGGFTQSLSATRDIGTNYELARPTLLKYTSEENISLENRAAKEKASHQDAYADRLKGQGGYKQQKFNKERFEKLQTERDAAGADPALQEEH